MELKSVTFFLTDRCSAACKICCFQCSPKNQFVMDESVILRYIEEAACFPSVEGFDYSGGEPLLYPDLLKRVIRYAWEKYRLPSALVSNGFWAADFEKGQRLMEELKDAGLIRVRLSADLYHQQYVPPETVKNAIRILAGLGMLKSVTIMDVNDGRHLRKTIAALRPEIYIAPKIAWYPALLPNAALGNSDIDITPEDLATPIPWDSCCCVDKHAVQLYTDGYMYNCCSQFSFEMPCMRVGKIGETTLAEAVKVMNRDPVLDLVRRIGISWFAERARELGCPVRENYSMGCELCRDLLNNRELMKTLRPLAKQKAQELRLQKLLKLGNGSTTRQKA